MNEPTVKRGICNTETPTEGQCKDRTTNSFMRKSKKRQTPDKAVEEKRVGHRDTGQTQWPSRCLTLPEKGVWRINLNCYLDYIKEHLWNQ